MENQRTFYDRRAVSVARRPQEVSVGPPLKVKQLLQRDPNVRPRAREAGPFILHSTPAMNSSRDLTVDFKMGLTMIYNDLIGGYDPEM